MINLLGRSDISGQPLPPGTHWLDEKIVLLDHSRDRAPGEEQWKDTVFEVSDGWKPQKPPVDYKKNPRIEPQYNHYVPYARILDAIRTHIANKTRRQILIWLLSSTPAQPAGKCVLTDLGLALPTKVKTKILQPAGDPLQNRFAYKLYVEAAIATVCYYPGIMYFGQGTPKASVKDLDTPTTPGGFWPGRPKGFADSQTALVRAGAMKLQTVLPELSLANGVSITRRYKRYSTVTKDVQAAAISAGEDDAYGDSQSKRQKVEESMDDLIHEVFDVQELIRGEAQLASLYRDIVATEKIIADCGLVE